MGQTITATKQKAKEKKNVGATEGEDGTRQKRSAQFTPPSGEKAGKSKKTEGLTNWLEHKR